MRRARSRPGERLPGRVKLTGDEVHRRLVADMDAFVVWDGRAELALHVEEAVRESGGASRGEAGACRIRHLDFLGGAQVDGFLRADLLREAYVAEAAQRVDRGAAGMG